jgi:hypothetical protein
MNIEEFYDRDPRRRSSDEVVFGRDWLDEAGVRCEVSWVADTGELFVMLEPGGRVGVDPAVAFGALSAVSLSGMATGSVSKRSLTVEILGVIPERDRVEHVMAGWREAMGQPQSIRWVVDRVASAD